MSPDQRVIELEMHCAHLQRLYDQLNEVVLEQQAQLDRLRRQWEAAQQRLQAIEFRDHQQLEETRDPRDEKPPHY